MKKQHEKILNNALQAITKCMEYYKSYGEQEDHTRPPVHMCVLLSNYMDANSGYLKISDAFRKTEPKTAISSYTWYPSHDWNKRLKHMERLRKEILDYMQKGKAKTR